MGESASELIGTEIEGQIAGYWIAPWATLHARRPSYRATGAVLPAGAHDRFLDLVEVDGRWFPLSEAGVHSYAHTTGLLRGERWRFLCFDGRGRRVFAARRGRLLDASDVARSYGPAAAALTRHDARSVELILRRAPLSE